MQPTPKCYMTIEANKRIRETRYGLGLGTARMSLFLVPKTSFTSLLRMRLPLCRYTHITTYMVIRKDSRALVMRGLIRLGLLYSSKLRYSVFTALADPACHYSFRD